jgi:hypothetical protein
MSAPARCTYLDLHRHDEKWLTVQPHRRYLGLGVFTAAQIAKDVITARAKIAELLEGQGAVAVEAARPGECSRHDRRVSGDRAV